MANLQVFWRHIPGQIITTSAEVTLNGGLVRESPQNPLNSGLGIILICPEYSVKNIFLTFYIWSIYNGWVEKDHRNTAWFYLGVNISRNGWYGWAALKRDEFCNAHPSAFQFFFCIGKRTSRWFKPWPFHPRSLEVTNNLWFRVTYCNHPKKVTSRIARIIGLL